MFSYFFKKGQKRAATTDDVDDVRMSSPATKKRKTSHGTTTGDVTTAKDTHASTNDDLQNDDGNDNNNMVVAVVLNNKLLFSTIISFLDYGKKLNLATCCQDFYQFFANQAKLEWDRFSTEATTVDRDHAQYRMRVMAGAVLTLRDRHNEQQLQRQQQQQQQGMVWSIWYSLLNMWQRRQFLRNRTMEPHRYLLQYSYKVPLNLYRGYQFGPSCSCVIDNIPSDGSEAMNCREQQQQQQQQQLACITASGAVLLLNGSTMDIDMAKFTRKAEPSFPRHYSWIFDKLWYLPKMKKGNDDDDDKNNIGLLILKHHMRDIPCLRVLDLAKTNQSIGREGEFDDTSILSARGIDQRRIAPNESFLAAYTSVAVSAKHGLVFFLMPDHNQGTICIESYNATSDGPQQEQEQLVASTRHPTSFTLLFQGGMEVIRQRLGVLRPLTRAIVTQDKLVVVYYIEKEHDPLPPLGFGIYVFDIHDLSFSHYIPMFDSGAEVHVFTITADWILYEVLGTTPYNVYNVVQITGGHVGHADEICVGKRTSILLVTDASVYAYDEDEREGNIEIDQFDIITGKKVRTLETGIPWTHHEENDDDDFGRRGVHRMMAAAHVVGNKLVILITSVGSIRNTIVTFALPPSPYELA